MNTLLEQIKKKNAKAFTHSGKFHADDVFSYALLLYLNPAITITRGNKVPKDFDGIVFDIGRGKYDHHQKDSRIRENGIPYAAFGLLWEELGKGILGEELAAKFEESVIQPLDNNDNTGEKIPPPLAFDVLAAVEEQLPGFPIVLHGSSSVPQEIPCI